MTRSFSVRALTRLVTLATLVAGPAYAGPPAPGCETAFTTTAWIACRARETRDPRLCQSIPDTTLKHICSESAGAGGCEKIGDPTMNHLCLIHAEIR